MTKRAKNLSDTDVTTIIAILDGWSDKLTWELLLTAIEVRLHQKYTRQALSKHERVLHAFQLRKTNVTESGSTARRVASSPELELALQRITRLESENARLEVERANFLEQFARWAYHAHSRGLSIEMLSAPLPSVNRDQTKKTLRSIKGRQRDSLTGE